MSCDYTMEEMGRSILLFMDAIGLKACHAMAASLGCGYLLAAVEKAPQRFGKLTLLCPGEITEHMPKRVRQMAAPLIGPLFRELYGLRYYSRELRTAYYDATACTPRVCREYYKTSDSYASRQSIMYCLRNYDLEAVAGELSKLEHRIFVLWGEMDRWQPIKYIRWWKSTFRTAIISACATPGTSSGRKRRSRRQRPWKSLSATNKGESHAYGIRSA